MRNNTLIVTAAVIVKDGKVLLARRKSGASAGKWEFPGGKIRKKETPEECLEREIREELGLRICVEKEIARTHHTNRSGKIELLFFLCREVEGKLVLRDHDAAAWVTADGIGGYDLSGPDREFVERDGSWRNMLAGTEGDGQQ